MDKHRAFGYKVTYKWILDRAKEMGMVPREDSVDARADVMYDYLVAVAGRAGLLRDIRPIAVKGRGVIAYCLASTDPSDGLPSRATDAKKIEKLRQMVGQDGPPNWWWQE